MNLHLYIVLALVLGVATGFGLSLLLRAAKSDEDSDRLDLVEANGLHLVRSPNGSSWGVLSEGMLLATGETPRAAIDTALLRSHTSATSMMP